MSERRRAWTAGLGTGLAAGGAVLYLTHLAPAGVRAFDWGLVVGTLAAVLTLAGVVLAADNRRGIALPLAGTGGILLVGTGAIASGLLVLVGATLAYGAQQKASPSVFEDPRENDAGVSSDP
jgi:hypothetical protein